MNQQRAEPSANLGLATTGELLDEIRARIDVDWFCGGGGLGYSTVHGRPEQRLSAGQPDTDDERPADPDSWQREAERCKRGWDGEVESHRRTMQELRDAEAALHQQRAEPPPAEGEP